MIYHRCRCTDVHTHFGADINRNPCGFMSNDCEQAVRADLNFSDEAPSIDLNGTDTERDHEHRGEGNTILHVHRS